MKFYSKQQEKNHIVINILGFKIKIRQKGFILPTCSQLGEQSYSGAKFISPNAKIGKYCSIGTGSMIGADIHPTNFVTTSPKLLPEYIGEDEMRFPKITIENDVWIGANAIIFPNGGGYIASGAVVAAGAVVTHNVPPYAIVAGVPAKIIKYRFDEKIRERLLESKWWDMPYEILKEFHTRDVNIFLKQVKEYNEK